MCTAINVKTPKGVTFLGRTMDFSYPLRPELFYVPRAYEWNNGLNTHRIRNRYAYMGIGQKLPPIAFADGVNEMGLAAAALYFPGYACYDDVVSPKNSDMPPVAAIELVGFLLGLCANVEQAASVLGTIRIVGVEDSVTGTIAPLHWIVSDRSGKCMAVEKMEDGLHLTDNPSGVLSNSPDLNWHMTNLRNYANVSPVQSHDNAWDKFPLPPFGQGGGTFGLPGDYTPPSRFVRCAYIKSHTEILEGRTETVPALFHMLDSVTIPRGIVKTSRGTYDYTQYTAFMDLSNCEYFFKTYSGSRICSAKFPERNHEDVTIRSLGVLT